jgi:hypothetical protein
MKIVYLKNEKKEIVFSEIVKSEKARELKLKLMGDSKFNGCSGFIVNLDSVEGVFKVKVKAEAKKPTTKKK